MRSSRGSPRPRPRSRTRTATKRLRGEARQGGIRPPKGDGQIHRKRRHGHQPPARAAPDHPARSAARRARTGRPRGRDRTSPGRVLMVGHADRRSAPHRISLEAPGRLVIGRLDDPGASERSADRCDPKTRRPADDTAARAVVAWQASSIEKGDHREAHQPRSPVRRIRHRIGRDGARRRGHRSNRRAPVRDHHQLARGCAIRLRLVRRRRRLDRRLPGAAQLRHVPRLRHLGVRQARRRAAGGDRRRGGHRLHRRSASERSASATRWPTALGTGWTSSLQPR